MPFKETKHSIKNLPHKNIQKNRIVRTNQRTEAINPFRAIGFPCYIRIQEEHAEMHLLTSKNDSSSLDIELYPKGNKLMREFIQWCGYYMV